MRQEQSKVLSSGDVRAERNRHSPMIRQEELAAELRWYPQIMPPVESGDIELSQAEYQRMLDAISRIVAKRPEKKEAAA